MRNLLQFAIYGLITILWIGLLTNRSRSPRRHWFKRRTTWRFEKGAWKRLPEITQEEINRYMQRPVKLSPEDEAALEKSKPGLMRAIKNILRKPKLP